MPAKGSESNGPLVVELVDALFDDGGAFARTVAEVLGRDGLEIRPGSLDQVAGAGAGWALATLLEGHGQEVDSGRLAGLERAVVAGWRGLAASGRPRLRPAAMAAVRDAAVSRPVGLLTALPEEVATAMLQASGVADASAMLIIAAGADGLPRPGVLAAWLSMAAPAPARSTALLTSAPALLAAIGAGCDDVALVGGGNPAAMMLAERRVASVEAGLGGR